MFRAARRLPFFRVFAIAQLALLARRHLQALTPVERRRFVELVRRGRSLQPAEREELRGLVARLQPGAFAGGVADAFSPVPLPRRFTGRRR
jgi:hypothetical protein